MSTSSFARTDGANIWKIYTEHFPEQTENSEEELDTETKELDTVTREAIAMLRHKQRAPTPVPAVVPTPKSITSEASDDWKLLEQQFDAEQNTNTTTDNGTATANIGDAPPATANTEDAPPACLDTITREAIVMARASCPGAPPSPPAAAPPVPTATPPATPLPAAQSNFIRPASTITLVVRDLLPTATNPDNRIEVRPLSTVGYGLGAFLSRLTSVFVTPPANTALFLYRGERFSLYLLPSSHFSNEALMSRIVGHFSGRRTNVQIHVTTPLAAPTTTEEPESSGRLESVLDRLGEFLQLVFPHGDLSAFERRLKTLGWTFVNIVSLIFLIPLVIIPMTVTRQNPTYIFFTPFILMLFMMLVQVGIVWRTEISAEIMGVFHYDWMPQEPEEAAVRSMEPSSVRRRMRAEVVQARKKALRKFFGLSTGPVEMQMV
ncbi:hypothetical protein EDC01DRAFT_632552 [Geopyxis carbonaria]|nr:hypothetical protein EDC01DRAFT_632552 [Geopyxis carbonaria]